jgi:leucine dehydrogenase
MSPFTHPSYDDHVQVVYCRDPAAGLSAIIAIHDLTCGPALGGCRMWPYADDDTALADALRLSRGMTYKSALAGLPYGGGKSVIIGDPRTDKSPALFRAMGRFVQSLGGRYTVAEDVGICVEDVIAMARETRFVAGIPAGGAGDPSPATAWGVFHGIHAAVRHRLGLNEIAGVRVAVQGLGHVGLALCGFLADAGARLIVSDIRPDAVARAVARFGAEPSAPGDIHRAPVDVFAPCALGAVLNDATIPEIRARVIAGSANNQLAEPRHAAMLAARGILYAPDYAINAGGIISVSHEGPGCCKDQVFAHVARIADTLADIVRRAEADGITTAEAADRIAESHFRAHHREQRSAA